MGIKLTSLQREPASATQDIEEAELGTLILLQVHNRTGLDLSGSAVDYEVWEASDDGQVLGANIVYINEATSADAGVEIRAGTTADPNGFVAHTSDTSQNEGTQVQPEIVAALNQEFSEGDIISIGTAGGKTGTGIARVTLLLGLNPK